MSHVDASNDVDDGGSVKSLFRMEQMIVFAVLAVSIVCAMLPTIFNATIRICSTSKDPSVGNVTPIVNVTDLKLGGRRALVVGGTRGIGRGIALTLARGGSSVTVVGRDTHKIVDQIKAVVVAGSDQEVSAFSADLSTVAGGKQLVESFHEAGTQPFDYVFFTVGCWPNYSIPFTSNGIEQVVALDLLSHHVVLTGLANHDLLKPGSRVMNTIASTQKFPFQSKDSVKRRLTESINKMKGPGVIPCTLFPVAVAGDAWLREASKRYPDVRFIGMFPGIVSTDLPQSTFPTWIMPILRAGVWPIAVSEEESGLAHVTVLASQNVGRHAVSFFNHLLEGRKAHPVAQDDALSAWVFEWLESTTKGLDHEA